MPTVYYSTNDNDCNDMLFKKLAEHPLLTKEQEIEYSYAVLSKIDEIHCNRLIRRAETLNSLKTKYNVTDNKGLARAMHRSQQEIQEAYDNAVWARSKLQKSQDAREKLVSCNIRLVISIAKKYVNRNVDLKDLIQFGILGLIQVPGRFDPSKGYCFSTYATFWIKQAITSQITEQSRPIRLPTYVCNILNQVKKARQELSQILKRTPSNAEIAAHLEMDASKLDYYLTVSKRATNVDSYEVVNSTDLSGSNYLAIAETLACPQAPALETLAAQMESLYYVKCLDPIEKEVVYRHFGLEPYSEEQTFKDIAVFINKSPQRTRQVYRTAIAKMKRLAAIKNKLLDSNEIVHA